MHCDRPNASNENTPRGSSSFGSEKDSIAIIGIGCRFPGADGPRAFWKLLVDGIDAITEVPAGRFDIDSFYDPRPGTRGKIITKLGGFLKDVDCFDASFFNISPREAASMDPQHRLLLEAAWEALEDAGQLPASLAGSKTGVFVGCCSDDYINLEMHDPNLMDVYVNAGGSRSVSAGRISYLLGLQGPSLSIDSACASSLVAVHLACQSLWSGECALAFAGGVNLILQPELTVGYSQAKMLAPDSRCKPFDSRANGFVRSDGVGLVLLKPLSAALADGDPIYAAIRGSAVSNDGRCSGFLMTPSREGQEAVLRDAYRNAGVSPAAVHYVEAHGTGTSVGDPVEAGALGAVVGRGRAEDRPCFIGSVKSNIGHTEAAAGIAGLIKVALSVSNRILPASRNLIEPNPAIPFKDYSLKVQSELSAWPVESEPALAGVSSFGINGTNAHVVIEEVPSTQATPEETGSKAELLTISANSQSALEALARSYSDYFKAADDTKVTLRDICYSASLKRTHHEHRLTVVGESFEEMSDHLNAFSEGEARRNMFSGDSSQAAEGKIVFVFPGQGSQWFGMAKTLLQEEPVFRESLERCEQVMREFVDWSLLDQLNATEENSRLREIEVIQPTLFAIQVSLAAMWRSWGIEPDAVIGQSMGEVAAAHVAGALSLQDAARIICRRSQLLKRVSGKGGMAVIGLSFEQTQRALAGYEDRLSIAVSSSPMSTVVSGDQTALEKLLAQLEQQDTFCRPIKVDVASHSPQMDPLRDDLLRILKGIQPLSPSCPIYSTVKGRRIDDAQLDEAYWVSNLREPVLFSATVQRLLESGHEIFIEVSPNPIALNSIDQVAQANGKQAQLLPTMLRDENERAIMLGSLGALHVAGYPVDWNRLYPRKGRYVRLPSFTWQKERFWFEESRGNNLSAGRYHRGGQNSVFLGESLKSAIHDGTHFWETELSTDLFPYLEDHRVQGTVVVPGAAYLEMALAAARSIYGERAFVLENVAFKVPLVLPAEGTRKVQLVVSSETSGSSSFRFYSLSGDDSWTLHSTGEIRSTSDPAIAESFAIEQIKSRCEDEISADKHYNALQQRGLQYGPSFQGVRQIWRREGEAIGRISLAESERAEIANYQVHPSLLDACFQVVAGTLPSDTRRISPLDTYLPVGLKSLQVYERPGSELWSHITLRADSEANDDVFIGDAYLQDDQGNVVLAALGLSLQRLGQRALTKTSDWLYEIQWEPQMRVESTSGAGNSWLIFMDQAGVGESLKSQLESRGDSCVTVIAGAGFSKDGAKHFTLDPAQPEHFTQLLTNEPQINWRGIVYLWGLDTTDASRITIASLEKDQQVTCAGIVHLIQGLNNAGVSESPRLWLVSRGLQKVTGVDANATAVAQSPLFGLGRVISNEHAELRCTKIDLSNESSQEEIQSLSEELRLNGNEYEIALRGSDRYVTRMRRYLPEASSETETTEPVKDQPFRLEVSKAGTLDALQLREVSRTAPRAGEIEIKVRATSLNFRDCLVALGFIPPAKPGGPLNLGWDCAGEVTALGEGVEGFAIGDEVVAVASPCFSAYAIANAHAVVPKPGHLSFEEAATIPIAYLTAYYSLHEMGRLRRGERILIHAASGAVGIAAIQLAQLIGAEIFATAGSSGKREFLKSIGVEHVMDSRSLDFADEIRRITNGEGVDMVLNSIAGDAIVKGLSILRNGGRFVELGKTDILQNNPVGLALLEKNISFITVDVAYMHSQNPEYFGELLRAAMRYFESRAVEPPPIKVYPLSQTVEAFRSMTRAEHIGKLVVSIQDQAGAALIPARQTGYREDATYLITGGLSGLGLTVAQWMVDHGAKHLVLLGRSGASSATEKVLDQMRASGAEIIVARADVTQRDQILDVVKNIKVSLPPLRGVVHAAAILDDGILLQLNYDRFDPVMAPKVKGAWNLHTLTADQPLDFFILFSSVASVLGSPGQANYVAGNAFLDALARYRRGLGLPALCINWGPWSEVGLAARPDRGARLAFRGIGSIAPKEGLEVLGALMDQSPAEISVMPFNLREWREFYPSASKATIFSHLENEEKTAEPAAAKITSGSTRDVVFSVDATERRNVVELYLQEQLAKVLRCSVSKLPLQQPINRLGLDSLMAVELRNRIQSDLGVSLPLVNFLKGPSIVQLGAEVLEQLPVPETVVPEAQVVDDIELRARLETEEDGFVPPRFPTEHKIAEILAGLLGITGEISIHDNFFALEAKASKGGSAASEPLVDRLQSRLRDLFEINLSSEVLVESPTIAELAVVIVSGQAEQMDQEELDELLAELGHLSQDEAWSMFSNRQV